MIGTSVYIITLRFLLMPFGLNIILNLIYFNCLPCQLLITVYVNNYHSYVKFSLTKLSIYIYMSIGLPCLSYIKINYYLITYTNLY